MKESDKFRGLYIKRPVPVVCEQFSVEDYQETGYLPEGVHARLEGEGERPYFYTSTTNGDLEIRDTDWVIKDMHGGYFYPCPNGLFMDTYIPRDEYEKSKKSKPFTPDLYEELQHAKDLKDIYYQNLVGIRDKIEQSYEHLGRLIDHYREVK